MTNPNPLVSVVLPCLNEAPAVGICIGKIKKVFTDGVINGEIIVCDNGSTDDSAAIAEKLGVKVVHQPVRGYGSAYLKGFENASGEFLIMVDADDSYDFNDIPRFMDTLMNGKYDFVTGNRYCKGYQKETMHFLHYYIGNPLLTGIANFLFGVNYRDVYSGFRGFRRTAYELIRPASTGMEFNLELAINAKLAGLKVAEIPVSLNRRRGISKLRTFKDGWRSVRWMLSYRPNRLKIPRRAA